MKRLVVSAEKTGGREFQSGVFFQHFLGKRRRKKKKKTQQYFWTSFALYSPRKHSPTYTPSTVYISLPNAHPSGFRRDAAVPRDTRIPWGIQPPPGAGSPGAPQFSGKPPRCWDPDIGCGTHWDVGDQPVPPETVPGVGSTGSIGVHQHQHVLLALQERRGARDGHAEQHQGLPSHEPSSRSFIHPPQNPY